jgi:predicted O-methyltransferase YrrM
VESSLKTRIDLARYFNELGFRIGAEIGVYDGYFSEELCKHIPGLKLYAIDSWQTYKNYKIGYTDIQLALAYRITHERLEKYDTEIIKAFSMDAVKDFKDNSLDFVYIDGNHEYSHVKEDIEMWTPKVRKGGVVSGHDYYITRSGNEGVINAVNEYIEEHGYKLQTTKWNRHGRVKDNYQPSWYFLKEE